MIDTYFNARDILDKAIGTDAYFQIKSILHRIPAADVVAVVRCRECRHWHDPSGWCDKHSTFLLNGEPCRPDESAEWKMFDEDDFCSWGERRDDDAVD